MIDRPGYDEIEATPIYHERHGAFVKPGYRGVGIASGIGDLYAFIEYEAEQANIEALRERQERFTPHDELQETESVACETVEREPDWQLSVSERWAIANQVEWATPRMDGETAMEYAERLQEITNCTKLARSFERWVQAGCPTTKGK